MLLTLISAACLLQTPKTFEELELAKIKDFRELKRYREDLKISVDGVTVTQVSTRDNRRYRSTMEVSTGIKLDTYCDGALIFVVNPPDKSFSEFKVSDEEVFDPKKHLIKAENGSLNIKWDLLFPVRFAIDAQVELKFEEDASNKEKLRKVTATAHTSEGEVTLTQWFKTDKWLLQRFTIKATSEGEEKTAHGEVKISELKQVQDKDFTWLPKSFPDFKKVSVPIGG